MFNDKIINQNLIFVLNTPKIIDVQQSAASHSLALSILSIKNALTGMCDDSFCIFWNCWKSGKVSVYRLVGWWFCLSACHIFLKGQEVTLPRFYRSTCFYLFVLTESVHAFELKRMETLLRNWGRNLRCLLRIYILGYNHKSKISSKFPKSEASEISGGHSHFSWINRCM